MSKYWVYRGSNLHFMIRNEVEQLFMCLSFTSFFRQISFFFNPLPVFQMNCFTFYYWFIGTLFTNISSINYVANTFYPSIICFLIVYMHAKSLQLCPTLCEPMDCCPPDSSVHGILQARILEGVAISSSRGSSQPRDGTCVSCVSCIAGSSSLSHQENQSFNFACHLFCCI